MSTVSQKLKNFVCQRYFPFLCLGIYMLLFHISLPMGFGDDATFASDLQHYTIFEYTAIAFQSWSSRVLIYFLMYTFSALPAILWRLADTLIVLCIALCLSCFMRAPSLKTQRAVNWSIAAFLVMYPWQHMATAGWIATTVNYLWVFAFILVALIPVKKLVCGEKIRGWEYPLYSVALLFGANTEQGAVVLFGVYAVALIYLLVKKKNHPYMWLQMGLTVACLCLIALHPGNAYRVEVESARYFPDFPMLSVLQKMDMGISRTLDHFFFTPNIVTIAAGVLIAAGVFFKTKKVFYRAIGLVPLLVTLVFGALPAVLGGALPALSAFSSQFSATNTAGGGAVSSARGLINFNNFDSPGGYAAFMILAVAMICVLLSVWIVFGKNKTALFLSVFLLSCFATSCAMGFSPTIFASAERTLFYMYAGFMVFGIALIRELYQKWPKRAPAALLATLCFAVLSLAGMAMHYL